MLALGAIAPALAQHPAHGDTPRARELYQRALTHYDLAEYDRAVDEFKEAYELSQRPELLFNLAQTYRAKKDYEVALHFYVTFLRLKPDAPNRKDVEERIAEMEKARTSPAPPGRVSAPPERVSPPLAAPLSPRAPPPFNARAPFWKTGRGQATIAIGIVGALSFIGAAAAGGVAVARRGAYDTSCNTGPCNDSLYSDGRGAAIGADVLLSVGIAAAVTVTILALTRPRVAQPVDASLRF